MWINGAEQHIHCVKGARELKDNVAVYKNAFIWKRIMMSLLFLSGRSKGYVFVYETSVRKLINHLSLLNLALKLAASTLLISNMFSISLYTLDGVAYPFWIVLACFWCEIAVHSFTKFSVHIFSGNLKLE